MLPNLHDSAKVGNLEAIRELLGPEIDVNLVDKKFGKTPVCWAAEYGQLEVTELLLNHGADFSLADLNGRKPLLWAARYGYKRIVQLLLDRGDTVDSKDKNGRVPLSLAAREGHMDVVKLLIKYGDEIDSEDVKKQTPLSFAAMKGHLEIVLLLLAIGANPDSRECSKNRSPLSFAAENGHVDVVKWLLAKDCEVDSKDSNERTALSWAAENGDDEMVEVLLADGADVNSKDKYNRTPLSYASELGNTAAVDILLQVANIDYDLQDTYYDQTPLSWAAEGGHDEIVRLLLEMGADADSRDRAGQTPLLWAIRNGHEAVIELLIDQEVEVIVRDEENWTPLSFAAHLGDKPLTQRLLLKAVELNSKVKIAIAEAIEDALWRASESLSDSKEDLEQAKQDPSLKNNLSIAIPIFGLTEDEMAQAKKKLAQAKEKLEAKHNTVLKHEAVVNLILENDEYLNIKDYKERTLLSWAAENGHDSVLELLLSRGLSPNSIDRLNRTPISWAARGGRESTLVILLNKKVHPDWRDGAGRTPLSLAAEKGHEGVVEILLNIVGDPAARVYALPMNVKKKPAVLYSTEKFELEQGVDLDSRDYSGQTPLLFAAKEGQGNIVSLLFDKGANVDVKSADNRSLWQLIEDELRSPWTDESKVARLQNVQMLLESRIADGQVLTAPIQDNASVDRQFDASIVNFTVLEGRKRGRLYRRCSVLDLLNGKMTDEKATGKQISCKWLHVPANNMRWVEVIQEYIYPVDKVTDIACQIIIAKHCQEQRLWKHHAVLKKELWAGLQHRELGGIYHSRFMRPTCQALPGRTFFHHRRYYQELTQLMNTAQNADRSTSTDDLDLDSEEALNGLVLFMPYLHWDTEDNVYEMKAIIKQHEIAKSRKPNDCQINSQKEKSRDYFKMQEFVQAYLDDKHPLHIRRTLDQFYYYVLKNTDLRDKDQTGGRYYSRFRFRGESIITMVDQLWLWVLPGFGDSLDTVITSFPQRSNRANTRGGEKFTALFSNIIAQTQGQPLVSGYKLAEIIASECSRIYFDTMTDRDRSLQFLDIYTTSIGDITDKKTQNFDRFQKTLEQNSKAIKLGKVSANAISITEEVKLLQEVKDIRDELNIMLSVFSTQRKVLKDMARIIYKTGMAERGSRSIQQDHHQYPLPLSTVDSNIREVEDMDKLAERVNLELNHLLELKQKQASVLEAQAARFQAERTVELTMAARNQGKMITFFTIITIVFMPLSFMAAFFAINISEFPKDAGDGLPLAYVSKYTFSISVAVIAPSILVAFNLQNIEDFINKHKEGKSVGAGSGVEETLLEALEAEGKRKQKITDEEQGRTSAIGSF